MKLLEEEAAIESILFVAGEPVALQLLANALDLDLKTTKSLVINLMDKYAVENRGLLILEIDGSYQMCTNPAFFEFIKKIYQGKQPKTLSQTLMETLAIVAYKQPITKGQIEEIRGVNADHAVNKLMEYGLITEKGRLNAPGKPILFGTSDEFLKYFGMANLDHLPSLGDDNELALLKQEALSEIVYEN